MNRLALIILDGWGESSLATPQNANAIAMARTPHWDALMSSAPHTLLQASGGCVGLPDGQMGNSEVGHLTIGAGRIIDQDLTRIQKSIDHHEWSSNPILLSTFQSVARTSHSLHILGLLSPGGVHSHEDHIFACIKMAHQEGIRSIVLHLFLDGRDTPPQSAQRSLEKLEEIMAPLSGVSIGSVSGRYYAMDRDKRWDRVKQAYDAIVYGQSDYQATSALEALSQAYQRGETDEFVKPTCILSDGKPHVMQSGDSAIYMNFRSDRARALSYALWQKEFNGFSRGDCPPQLEQFVTLTEYDPTLRAKVVFPPQTHHNVLSEYLQNQDLKQCHIAETEKYAHVTFFFNGGKEAPYEGETRLLIPSPKVSTYDQKPEMSAFEVTEALIAAIQSKKYDFIVCNYANADMVGHTGNLPATIQAIEALDHCLGNVFRALEESGTQALITSDHGNAECMVDEVNNQAHTAHTLSEVPLVYIGHQAIRFKPHIGQLSDVAPTILTLMDLPIPTDMTGTSLVEK